MYHLPVKFKLLDPKAKMPTYAKPGDAGADLYSIDWGVLEPKERRVIHTGLVVEIPYGYVGLVHPRSGLAHNYGVTVQNSPGTIDSGYRGEIMLNMVNHGFQPYSFCIGDRMAQLVIQEVIHAEFEEVEELSDSVRGTGGYGSTGGFNG
jgi:dUTP pyrophosphatase